MPLDVRTRNGAGFDDLVDALYGTAIDGPEDWGPCLRLVADAVGGVGPGLSMGGGPEGPRLWSLDVPQRRLDEWLGRFEEPLRAAVQRDHLAGTFLASGTGVPAWTEFLEDWAGPQGFADLLQGQTLGSTRMYGLGIFREREAPAFGRDEITLIDRLMPHVERALQLRERLASVVGARDAAASAMENLAIGFLLLDDRGQVIEASPAARVLLRAGDGLCLGRGELRTEDPRARAPLSRLLGEVARDPGHPGGSVSVARPSGRRPYELLAMRLPPGRMDLGRRASTAVVFVSDPEEASRPSERLVADLHGLTPAEARVACQLAVGKTPDEIAEALAITVQTVRNHLKSVYAKTDTRRQSELVARLLAGLGRLGPSEPS
jgi:DNA-binding CsgD family transcriptional regulator